MVHEGKVFFNINLLDYGIEAGFAANNISKSRICWLCNKRVLMTAATPKFLRTAVFIHINIK